MRRTLFAAALALVIVVVAVPSEACASADGGDPYPNCPEYEIAIGGEGLSVSADGYGRLLIDLHTLGLAPNVGYIVMDEPSLYGAGAYLWAISQYSETNGVPGLQRYDQLCKSVEHWWQADEFLFIC